MELIDACLPEYQFSEIHSVNINAEPETVIEAAANYDTGSDPFFRRMIALREMPMRVSGIFMGRQSALPPAFGFHNFTRLEHEDGRELVFGLAGRFWRAGFGLVSIADGEAFRAFHEPGVAKLAINFSAAVLETGQTRLSTQTRVFCPDRASRLKFAPYWYLIQPVSGLIRQRTLASIRKSSEQQQDYLQRALPLS